MTQSVIKELSINLRPAVAADLPAVEALLAASKLPTDGVAECIGEFVVAEAAGRVVGVVGMEYRGEYGLLRSTAVAPEWRGHGVARQLVEKIIARAEARGVNALYLLTTTAETYFPSFGFRTTTREAVPAEIRETGEFRGACPATATVMCCELRR
jgi:N-acetylglutamate synthase-like GNAT family acetyltransferase